MVTFRNLLEEAVAKYGSQSAAADAIGMDRTRFGRVLLSLQRLDEGKESTITRRRLPDGTEIVFESATPSFEVVNCLRLARALGRPPSEVLNAAGKAEEATLLEALYGPASSIVLSEYEHSLINALRATWIDRATSQKEGEERNLKEKIEHLERQQSVVIHAGAVLHHHGHELGQVIEKLKAREAKEAEEAERLEREESKRRTALESEIKSLQYSRVEQVVNLRSYLQMSPNWQVDDGKHFINVIVRRGDVLTTELQLAQLLSQYEAEFGVDRAHSLRNNGGPDYTSFFDTLDRDIKNSPLAAIATDESFRWATDPSAAAESLNKLEKRRRLNERLLVMGHTMREQAGPLLIDMERMSENINNVAHFEAQKLLDDIEERLKPLVGMKIAADELVKETLGEEAIKKEPLPPHFGVILTMQALSDAKHRLFDLYAPKRASLYQSPRRKNRKRQD